MAEPGALAGSEVHWHGCHLDIYLLSRPIGLLGRICLFGAHRPGADESGPTYPHETRLLIKAYYLDSARA